MLRDFTSATPSLRTAILSVLPALSLLMLVVCGSSLAQDAEVDVALAELERTSAALEQMSFSEGRANRQFLEPLNLYSQQLAGLGRYDEAADALSEVIQILRVTEGLYTPNQYKYLLKKIEILMDDGDWRRANKLMEHIGSVLRRPDTTLDAELVQHLMALSALHTKAITRDSSDLQSLHFRTASRNNDLAIDVAEAIWEDSDRRRAPLLYQWVIQQYLQASAVEVGGSTAMSLRTHPIATLVRTRRDTRLGFYYLGMLRLNQIRGIFLAQAHEDLEAIALLDMYLADWQVLFSHPEEAALGYLRSYNGLLDAGIDRGAINQFFSEPRTLPVPVFASSFAAAKAAQSQAQSNTGAGPNLQFTQWSAAFPFTVAAVGGQQSAGDEFALFSINLLGLNEISRWYRGRLITSVSVVETMNLLDSSLAPSTDWISLEHSVKSIRFRPRLVDGVPQSVNTTLLYQFEASD